MICRGIINSFGVYQTYYGARLASEVSASGISWIGSLQGALLFSMGIITGPLFDWGYLRALLFIGSSLVVFGMMMASVSTHYWQIMLSQGLAVGIGSGCLFVPSIALLPMYFKKKRALALGIAAAGSSLGAILFTVVFRQLEPSIGAAWATRIIALIMLVTLSVPLAGMKMRVQPPSRRQFFDLAAWKEAPYTLFNLGFLFGLMGIYVPFFYLESYALNYINPDLSSYLLVILNASSFFGRIVPNFVADRTGIFNMLIPTSLITSLLAYVWIGIRNPPGLVVFAVLYGFFSGAFLSLPPGAVVALSPSIGSVGVRLGMNMFIASIGLAIGNPIAGAILPHSWASLQAYSASFIVLGALFFITARVVKVGWSVKSKF